MIRAEGCDEQGRARRLDVTGRVHRREYRANSTELTAPSTAELFQLLTVSPSTCSSKGTKSGSGWEAGIRTHSRRDEVEPGCDPRRAEQTTNEPKASDVGWEAGIRTPITASRAPCPTVERPPSIRPRRPRGQELLILVARSSATQARGTGLPSHPYASKSDSPRRRGSMASL